MMKSLLAASLLAGAMLAACVEVKPVEPVVCAYVAQGVPDAVTADYVNRIIYSHAYIDTVRFDVTVRDSARLRQVLELRRDKPQLEVLLSIGGSSAQFSPALRCDSVLSRVVDHCKTLVDSYGLDGIDIDWEYPGRGDNALSAEEDVDNYVKFLTALREALGSDKLITVACAGSGYGLDFEAMTPLVDQYNIMAYDMGTPPHHHSALYESERVGWITSDRSVRNFLEADVPPAKIVLGVPFYGRGRGAFADFVDWRDIALAEGMTERYDSVAQVPWIADSTGALILTYDNPASLRAKCAYAQEQKLGGVMYWRMETDDSVRTLARTVAEAMR